MQRFSDGGESGNKTNGLEHLMLRVARGAKFEFESESVSRVPTLAAVSGIAAEAVKPLAAKQQQVRWRRTHSEPSVIYYRARSRYAGWLAAVRLGSPIRLRATQSERSVNQNPYFAWRVEIFSPLIMVIIISSRPTTTTTTTTGSIRRRRRWATSCDLSKRENANL